MAWDGTLSVEEFERAALYLVTTWERCCPELPQWTWQKTSLSAIPGRACGYLLLQDVRVSSDREDYVERLDESDGDDHDAEDQATMYEDLVGDHEQHLYTYHVVYSESYRVPMLFLQGRLPDGRPLQWNSVLQDLPVGSQHSSNESRWTFLTQEDHPLLHRPWFALHPCGTSEIMSLVFSDFGIPKNAASVPEDLSEVSAEREKQVLHESSCGMAEIAASDRWEKPESWIENYVLTWMSFACPASSLEGKMFNVECFQLIGGGKSGNPKNTVDADFTKIKTISGRDYDTVMRMLMENLKNRFNPQSSLIRNITRN